MNIKFATRFASDSKVEEADVRVIKRALNRLGYYTPPPHSAPHIADRSIFEALKNFQRDQDIFADGVVKSGDPTEIALNKALTEHSASGGQYIWRNKVRSGHASREGRVFSWDTPPAGGHSGEDFGCRCWAEVVEAESCEELERDLANSQKAVKDLSERFHNLLLRLDRANRQYNKLINNAQKSLGAQVVAYLLTAPAGLVGEVSELLARYFGTIISEQLLQAANSFIKQLQPLRQKKKYLEDQISIVFFRLEREAKELEDAEEKLDECRKKRDP